MAALARFVVVLAIFIANLETVNQIKTETELCQEGEPST
jgi:hypothetical protein